MNGAPPPITISGGGRSVFVEVTFLEKCYNGENPSKPQVSRTSGSQGILSDSFDFELVTVWSESRKIVKGPPPMSRWGGGSFTIFLFSRLR